MIELLLSVMLVAVAVAVTVALPSYRNMMEQRQVTTGAEQVASSLNAPQGGVMKTNDEQTDSFSDTLLNDDGSVMLTHHVRRIIFALQGELIVDDTIERRIEDAISVRDEFIQGS